MTGPDHYREAEACIRSTMDLDVDEPPGRYAQLMTEAQVHATLALAAATGLCGADREAWQAAAGNGAVWHAQPQDGDTGE